MCMIELSTPDDKLGSVASDVENSNVHSHVSVCLSVCSSVCVCVGGGGGVVSHVKGMETHAHRIEAGQKVDCSHTK